VQDPDQNKGVIPEIKDIFMPDQQLNSLIVFIPMRKTKPPQLTDLRVLVKTVHLCEYSEVPKVGIFLF
jgi:hypothetical protein